MSIDFPRAWQIAEASKMEDHHPECSYRVTEGCILCDCDVLNKHPEATDDILQGTDGIPCNEREYIETALKRVKNEDSGI